MNVYLNLSSSFSFKKLIEILKYFNKFYKKNFSKRLKSTEKELYFYLGLNKIYLPLFLLNKSHNLKVFTYEDISPDANKHYSYTSPFLYRETGLEELIISDFLYKGLDEFHSRTLINKIDENYNFNIRTSILTESEYFINDLTDYFLQNVVPFKTKFFIKLTPDSPYILDLIKNKIDFYLSKNNFFEFGILMDEIDNSLIKKTTDIGIENIFVGKVINSFEEIEDIFLSLSKIN
ncbi:hypothetical protein KQ878_02585 [Mycoplasma zalophidermidis]|uniref:EAL domain-containing protein n=1 Tax=Mycoplasma zalophidermidis TaxID=398174 RepID=A0ABS6DRX8_9MOLU|nr:hypothetical protein [Mycoplasma zalophidermidis]MBU4693760.1 hypothetical protein [Mycoplasma zalophidermidis]